MNDDLMVNQILNLLEDGFRRSDTWLQNALSLTGFAPEREYLWNLCRRMRAEGLLEVIDVEDRGQHSLLLRRSGAPRYIDPADFA